MDESWILNFPSMILAVFVDESRNLNFPSMKRADFMDESWILNCAHDFGGFRGWEVRTAGRPGTES